jgi:hypothetical protein
MSKLQFSDGRILNKLNTNMIDDTQKEENQALLLSITRKIMNYRCRIED